MSSLTNKIVQIALAHFKPGKPGTDRKRATKGIYET